MKKRMSFTRWLWLALTAMLFMIGVATVQPVQAQSNKWVNDHTGVLSQQTMQRINTVNEKDFAKLPGHPQLMVEVFNKVPGGDDIDDYKADRFQQLGVGQKGWDNGLYFVIAIKQHKYGLEVGYGLESAVPDASESAIVPEHVKNLLRGDDYDQAVRDITNNIAHTLTANKSAIMMPSDIAQQKARHRQMMLIIGVVAATVVILLLAWIIWLLSRHARRQRDFDRLLRSDVDWPQSMTLINSFSEDEQDRFQTRIKAPWFGRSDPETVYRKAFANYVWANLTVLIATTGTKAPYPAYVYDSVKPGSGLAIPIGQNASALQRQAKQHLSTDAVNNMPNLAALVARIDAAPKFVPYADYQAAFEQWAADNKVTISQQAFVWREFTTNVSAKDHKKLATADAQTKVFAAILYHKQHPDEEQTGLVGLPVWVQSNFGGGSSSGGGFGSGGGGGMSGGGGFSGGW